MFIHIAYELDTRSRVLNTDFMSAYCLFGVVKLTKSAYPDKYRYCNHGITVDARSQFLHSEGQRGQDIAIFVVDISSSVHVGNKKTYDSYLSRSNTRIR